MVKKEAGHIIAGENCIKNKDESCDFSLYVAGSSCDHRECLLAKKYSFFPGDGFIHETYVNAVGSYKKLPECMSAHLKGEDIEIEIKVEVKPKE
jgi:hypothetical protein